MPGEGEVAVAMSYPIYTIEPEWVLEPEQLGTKKKFWIKDKEHEVFGETQWLFKYPTKNTGQHWAEKIAYEICRKINILAPRVELAEIDGERGKATRGQTFHHTRPFITRFALHSDFYKSTPSNFPADHCSNSRRLDESSCP